MSDEGGAPKSYDPIDVPAHLPPEEMVPVNACAAELSPAMRAVMLRHHDVRVICLMFPRAASRHMMHIGNVPEAAVPEVLRWAANAVGRMVLSREPMEPES